MSNLLTYTEDERKIAADGNPRFPAFKTGWTEAIKHDKNDDTVPKKYSNDPALDGLTWENLGFRLGILFDKNTENTFEEMKRELYEWCVNQQKESENTVTRDLDTSHQYSPTSGSLARGRITGRNGCVESLYTSPGRHRRSPCVSEATSSLT